MANKRRYYKVVNWELIERLDRQRLDDLIVEYNEMFNFYMGKPQFDLSDELVELGDKIEKLESELRHVARRKALAV